MPAFNLEGLVAPVSEADPCGPDLDLAGDVEYMTAVATAEALLPTSFFSGPEGQPFDRSTIDFAAQFAALTPFLEQTRDIRLLILVAKFSMLNRDLPAFATAVRAIQELLKTHWDEVHPRGEDGIFVSRMAALETLDDMPPVIFPLQYTPLVRHRRLGEISFRNYMIASGEVQAREGDSTLDQTAIGNALMEVELADLTEATGLIDGLHGALAAIRDVCTERAGFEQAAKFERLPALLERIRGFLREFLVRRDPSAALAGEAGAPGEESASGASTSASEVRSVADVADALAAVAEYFSRREPSSPALLLVRQAEQLIGKSFIEVIQILAPTYVEQATISIGKDDRLALPLERLVAIAPSSEDAAVTGDGEPPARRLQADTRSGALKLLDQIGAFYRAVEPSSPVPYLTDRARDLANRDFLTLLKHVLPDEALKSSETEG